MNQRLNLFFSLAKCIAHINEVAINTLSICHVSLSKAIVN